MKRNEMMRDELSGSAEPTMPTIITSMSAIRLQDLSLVAGAIVALLDVHQVRSDERCIIRNLAEILLERR